MSKMGSHDPFGHLKHKVWPKEGPWVKLPLKFSNRPKFLAYKWRAKYRWKDFNEGYNFVSDLILIGSLHTKLWAPKVVGVPIVGISGLALGSPETKWHLGAGPMASHRVYYKGEGGGFPQVRAVVNLMNRVCLWLILEPKVLQLCTNQLVVWFCVGLCEWLSAFHSSYSHPKAPARLSTPKVLRIKERVFNFLFFRCFHLKFTFEFIKELKSSSHRYN
jgi:hypothetical protein